MNLPGTFLLKSPYPTMTRRHNRPVFSVDSKGENGNWVIKSHLRDRPIQPGPVIGTQEEINEAFIALCHMASIGLHAEYLTDNITTTLKHTCHEMERWDLLPKKLLLSSIVKEEDLQEDVYEVTGIPTVAHLPITWSCELKITRYPMDTKTAFLFAEPKYCGITHPVPGGQCMALRSTCVIQMGKNK